MNKMTREEFEKKMATIPVEEPDEVDLAMLEEADRINDGETAETTGETARRNNKTIRKHQ